MGLATGSPFLVLRSAGRIWISVIVAVGGAATITLLLPFHELNAEILARTSPTVLDLITAGFCAFAGVYASLRPGSDTAATAAGTSIGISLVPPLCASGYGFGTTAWSVAGGAALLFLTNLVAIVVVETVAFVAAGFNRVDVVRLEHDELQNSGASAPIARALARRLTWLFESKSGPLLRFLMPFVLLGAVYMPLRRALDEVAWQVRVSTAARNLIARESLRVVQSRLRIEHHKIDITVVVLGNTTDAEDARARMDTEIRRVSGIVPHIEFLAVPDATAFAGLESTLLTPRLAETLRLPPPPSPDEQLNAARARIQSTIEGLWPTATAGAPLVVDVGTSHTGPLRVRVVHLGADLSADGVEAVRRAVETQLGRPVQLVDVGVPTTELTRQEGDLSFIARVSSAVRLTAGVAAINVCVVRPSEPPRGRKVPPAELELSRCINEVLSIHPRVTRSVNQTWSVRFTQETCITASPTDAGAPLDATKGG
jgi:hypothetical protein